MNELKILVVDDDQDHADSLAEIFTIEGHEVVVAYSGPDAISAFEETDFDIAFMDVMMPEMNGVESFLEIKRIRPGAQVIMMTGYSVDQLLRQASENGAVGVLHKPLDPKMILETLDNLVPSGIVLVAEADADFGATLQQMIIEGGWSCERVTNSDLALNHIDMGGVDALVLDLDMPLIDGLGVYKSLKASNIDVPTIMIAGPAEKRANEVSMSCSLEATGILTKPFELDDLLTKLPRLARCQKLSSKLQNPGKNTTINSH